MRIRCGRSRGSLHRHIVRVVNRWPQRSERYWKLGYEYRHQQRVGD